jgi:hypothetical protein
VVVCSAISRDACSKHGAGVARLTLVFFPLKDLVRHILLGLDSGEVRVLALGMCDVAGVSDFLGLGAIVGPEHPSTKVRVMLS